MGPALGDPGDHEWASLKSFKAKECGSPAADGDDDGIGGRDAAVDFKGQKRSQATHASTTDPGAQLCRKVQPGMAELFVETPP